MQLPNKFKNFDKTTLLYYIEKAEIELNQTTIDLISQYLDMGFSLERSIEITAGIIKNN